MRRGKRKWGWRTPEEEAPQDHEKIRTREANQLPLSLEEAPHHSNPPQSEAGVGLKDRCVCEEGRRMSTEEDEAVALGEMNQGGGEDKVCFGDGGVAVVGSGRAGV